MLKLNNGTFIKIPEFDSLGFQCKFLYLEEVIGGAFAFGKLNLVFDATRNSALEKITRGFEFTIRIGTEKSGMVFDNIHCVITTKIFTVNHYDLKFLCIPSYEFANLKSKRLFEGCDNAINQLWYNKNYKTNIDIRTKSDLTSDVKWYQPNSYDAEVLRNVCGSYKENSIYAFGLGGLLIKDIVGIDSVGKDETNPRTLIGCNAIVGQENKSIDINVEPNLYQKTSDPYSDTDEENENKAEEIQQPDPSKYFDVFIFSKLYRIVHSSYSQVRKNYFYNQKIYFSRLYETITLENRTGIELPYRLGDVVNYKRPTDSLNYPFGKYLISKIMYSFCQDGSVSKDQTRITYILRGLEENRQLMPTTDPTREVLNKSKV